MMIFYLRFQVLDLSSRTLRYPFFAMQGDTRISSSSGRKVRVVLGERGLADLTEGRSGSRPIRLGRSSSNRDFGLRGSGESKLNIIVL